MSNGPDGPRVFALIAAMAPIPVAAVDAGTRLRDDLGFDSIRLIELAMAMERRFDLPTLELGEAMDVITAGDVLSLVSRQLPVGDQT